MNTVASNFLNWAGSSNNTTGRDDDPEDTLNLFFQQHSVSATQLNWKAQRKYYNGHSWDTSGYLFQFNDNSCVEANYKNEWDIA